MKSRIYNGVDFGNRLKVWNPKSTCKLIIKPFAEKKKIVKNEVERKTIREETEESTEHFPPGT